jgi:hypothetical protein
LAEKTDLEKSVSNLSRGRVTLHASLQN